jgi:hypothetical protein
MKINETTEMMLHDYTENVNIMDLQIDEETLNKGYRLPTISELKEMHEIHKNGLGNFKNDWYMSSNIPERKTGADSMVNTCINFEDSRIVDRCYEESHWACCQVRLVKNIND